MWLFSQGGFLVNYPTIHSQTLVGKAGFPGTGIYMNTIR